MPDQKNSTALPEFEQRWPGVWMVEYHGHIWSVEARRNKQEPDKIWSLYRNSEYVGSATDLVNARANIIAFED